MYSPDDKSYIKKSHIAEQGKIIKFYFATKMKIIEIINTTIETRFFKV